MRYMRTAALLGCALLLLPGLADARSRGGYAPMGGGIKAPPTRSLSPPAPNPMRMAPSPSSTRSLSPPSPPRPTYVAPKPVPSLSVQELDRQRRDADARRAHQAERSAREAQERARKQVQETKPAPAPKAPTHPAYRDDPPKQRPAPAYQDHARERSRDPVYVPHTNMQYPSRVQPSVQQRYYDQSGGGVSIVHWMILMELMKQNRENPQTKRQTDEWVYRHYDKISPSQRDELRRMDPDMDWRLREMTDSGLARDATVFVPGVDDRLAKAPQPSSNWWLWIGIVIIVGAGVAYFVFFRSDGAPAPTVRRDPVPTPKPSESAKPKVPELMNPLGLRIGGSVTIDAGDCAGRTLWLDQYSEFTAQSETGAKGMRFVDYSFNDPDADPGEFPYGYHRTIRARPLKDGRIACTLLVPHGEIGLHERPDLLKELDGNEVLPDDLSGGVAYKKRFAYTAKVREVTEGEYKEVTLRCWEFGTDEGQLYVFEYDTSEDDNQDARQGIFHTSYGEEITAKSMKKVAGHSKAA